MPKVTQVPKAVRPFRHHGIDLDWEGKEQAISDCPFCGRENKFCLNTGTGEWRCFVCGSGSEKGGGNAYTFIRMLHQRSSEEANGELTEIAADRSLLYSDTVSGWGICESITTRDWLAPGYNPDDKLVQLYRYIKPLDGGKRKLVPTPELGLQAHCVPDKDKGTILIVEGLWNAMILWETLRYSRRGDGNQLELTANPDSSLLSEFGILAIPGIGFIGEPFTRWLPHFENKEVVLCFDSDHPKLTCRDCQKSYSFITYQNCPTCGKMGTAPVEPGGYAAVKRAAGMLLGSKHKPASITYLKWGPEGYEASRPSGWDIRDYLSQESSEAQRVQLLGNLLTMMSTPIPADWVPAKADTNNHNRPKVKSLPCTSYKELIAAWRKALKWRPELDEVLSVMLAVALSTDQVGDQLFLMVIADAGSAKTRLCDGMLVSNYCHPLEHLTGFHSGWHDNSGEDYSLLSRINHKTLITPEGDVLMSSSYFTEIMSQQRRIFDGSSGASYKNRKEDLRYEGLRTPWIIAGTPVLLNADQSRLGDRFVRIIIGKPDEDTRREILERVAHTAIENVKMSSNCSPESIINDKMLKAYQLTGGYVDYLRKNAGGLLNRVVVEDQEELTNKCIELAEFVSMMRARPDDSGKQGDKHDTVELPTRLTVQFTRLAYCLAVVMAPPKAKEFYVTDEVMRRVTKVALDTSTGRTYDIVQRLYRAGKKGCTSSSLAGQINHSEEATSRYLSFLRRIKVLDCYVEEIAEGIKSHKMWKLNDKLRKLYQGVLG